jgi:hypothetical protein
VTVAEALVSHRGLADTGQRLAFSRRIATSPESI